MQRDILATPAPQPPGAWAHLLQLGILGSSGSCTTGISASGRGNPSRGTARQQGGLPTPSSCPPRRGAAGMRSRQRMFAAVMRLLLKCLRLGRRRRFKLVRQVEQLWHYGHLCLRSLLYNSFTNGDVVLDSLFEPVYWLVDHVTRWFGVVFVALVIGLTSSIVAIVYICLLPLILQTYTPAWICWHLAYGHWNLIMIVFHYYMAITTSPGHPPQAKNDLTGVSICRKCIAPKPARTHHCSICNRHTTRPHHPPSPSASELSTRAWSTFGSCAARLHWPWVPSHCGTLPSLPAGKRALNGTSTERRGRDCRRKARSSGTPTVMAAGITGKCSWVWMCQGKILGKPLPEKVVAQQLLGL
ncbi:palmitoyltransferase ZDHHC16 isoform X8 [Parus major]|uniref:palmitoyltransferase ZDHHC16 isoform X8 n=1 Tax=Parus major TaxID=9157 RepID=UPI0007716639|nr:palmitoyltransferase ZDHHC16 isoform X8 [Parus major]